MSKDVMKLALEALENWVECFPQNVDDIDKKAITSLREALNASLAKPDFWEGYVPEPVNPAQQEPYCYTYTENGEEYFAPPTAYVPDNATPLYTSAQRTLQGLTDEERKLVRNSVGYNQFVTAGEYAEHVQKATEFKLLEKNNG